MKEQTENKTPSAIRLKANGAVYTLRFTARSVIWLQKQGFDFQHLKEEFTKLGTPYLLVEASLLAEHPMLDDDALLEIYKSIKDIGSLTSTLVEMLVDISLALSGSGESLKNAEWETIE